jgi:flagellar hook assembly protein FlgD
MHGVEVKHLINMKKISKGEHETNWDGTDDSGSKCNPGIYVILLEQNGQIYSQKVIHY